VNARNGGEGGTRSTSGAPPAACAVQRFRLRPRPAGRPRVASRTGHDAARYDPRAICLVGPAATGPSRPAPAAAEPERAPAASAPSAAARAGAGRRDGHQSVWEGAAAAAARRPWSVRARARERPSASGLHARSFVRSFGACPDRTGRRDPLLGELLAAPTSPMICWSCSPRPLAGALRKCDRTPGSYGGVASTGRGSPGTPEAETWRRARRAPRGDRPHKFASNYGSARRTHHGAMRRYGYSQSSIRKVR